MYGLLLWVIRKTRTLAFWDRNLKEKKFKIDLYKGGIEGAVNPAII